jgi:chemotaxis protein CheD
MEIDYKTHFLYPSAIYIGREPTLVTTILGSCVAVCIFDPIQQFGGINHYMLPFWNGHGIPSPKYGNIAIERLIERMVALGSLQRNLKAKVFGGGEVITTTQHTFHIGERNVVLAKEMLSEYNIPIISSSVGGEIGRKIIYNTANNEVRQKYVNRMPENPDF